MYEKNLTEDLRLRLSSTDMDFLRGLSAERGASISETIRGIIGEYRRSLDVAQTLKLAVEIARENQKKEGQLSHGDTKTDIHNLV